MIAWKGRRLAALDRRGNVRWSLTAARPVTGAHWSPSGFRVAYRAGQDLRVVAGDGTGDRLLDAGTFRPAAWRPGAAHVLAYLSGAHLDMVDVDTGRRLARIHLPHVPGALAWSADGSRLYVQPPPLDRDLRRARPPDRAAVDAGPPDGHHVRPRPRRLARRGRAARRHDRARSR